MKVLWSATGDILCTSWGLLKEAKEAAKPGAYTRDNVDRGLSPGTRVDAARRRHGSCTNHLRFWTPSKQPLNPRQAVCRACCRWGNAHLDLGRAAGRCDTHLYVCAVLPRHVAALLYYMAVGVGADLDSRTPLPTRDNRNVARRIGVTCAYHSARANNIAAGTRGGDDARRYHSCDRNLWHRRSIAN